VARRPAKLPEEHESPPVPPERRAFADNLKRFRLERGLTQVQLAELSGIAQGHFSQLETGSWEPRLATIMALSRALRLQPGDLLPLVDLDGFEP